MADAAPLHGKKFDTDRPILGRLPGVSGSKGDPIYYPGEGSMLTIAQSGSGKDRNIILPNLINYQGSVIVVDPKGEDADLTAAWRRSALGQPVHVFDPFGVVDPVKLPPGSLARFNPIDLVRSSRTPVEDAKVIAAALIPMEGGQNSHWSSGARQLLAGIMVFVALDPAHTGARNMGAVWRYLRLGQEAATDRNGNPVMIDLFREFLGHVAALSRVARRYAANEATAFLSREQKEASGHLSTLLTNCGAILDSPSVMDNMAASSVDFGTLQAVPTSVFLVLPGAFAESHSRWFRLLLGCAFIQVERAGLAPRQADGSRRSTLFILNEFFTLGRFPQIVEAMGRMRGYGVQFWTFVQNLSQLKEHYGDGWTNISGNAGAIQYFGGSADVFTMEYLSKLAGQSTVFNKSFSDDSKGQRSVSTSETGRPLLFPDEIGRLERGKQIIFPTGHAAITDAGMVDRLSDFPAHTGFLGKLSGLVVACPQCLEPARIKSPNPTAPVLRVGFKCHGSADVPHNGPGWRSMMSGEERERGRFYRSTPLFPDVWDVFEPEPVEEELPEIEEGDADMDPVEAVRLADDPIATAYTEAVVMVPAHLAGDRIATQARKLVAPLLVYLALDPVWSFSRDVAGLSLLIHLEAEYWTETLEAVAESTVAGGHVAEAVREFLSVEIGRDVVHSLLKTIIPAPTSN